MCRAYVRQQHEYHVTWWISTSYYRNELLGSWAKDLICNFHTALHVYMLLDFTPQTISSRHWKSPEVKWATCFQQLNWMFPLVACNDFLILLGECDGWLGNNKLPLIVLDLSFCLFGTLATKIKKKKRVTAKGWVPSGTSQKHTFW